MAAPAADPQQIRTAQRDSWDTAAQGWWTWWPHMERSSAAVTRQLLAMAGVTDGMRVLDVATGIGEPALSAARIVGPSGSVVAVDVSPAMLEIARQRVTDAQLDNVELVCTDELLAGVDGPFDAIVSRWGVMFFGDVPGFLERARELLAPGGRLALAVWASPQEVPMAATFAIAAEVLDVPPPAPDAPGPFRFADVDAFAATVAGAGFADVATDAATVRFELDSTETFTRFMADIAAPIKAWLAQQPHRADEVWAAVADAMRPFEGPDGFVMDNTSPLVAATRP